MGDRSRARRNSIAAINSSKPLALGIDYSKEPLGSIYGTLVFGTKEMQARMPEDAFRRLQGTIRQGNPLDPDLAGIVADAMRLWAEERGATHYTHWFQPMTGHTAEKHDAFLSLNNEGELLSQFSGKMLVKGESDASSFPSGGIRSTFEARGYTAWDPRSPVFLKENANGVTLCIPTAFCSYTGECLDRKTPLLRSMEALSKHALRLLRVLGNNTTNYVHSTLGAEQEYFLVDRSLFLLRPDLVNTGRTLYGARPPKGQEMEDHYYGSIRARVLAFMADMEKELYRLGIPAKTRHNEAAPGQFELAPLFEESNIATDHNMLIMETMRATAQKHGFMCLLHEKPFTGVNGSGKHCNWSLSDSEGNNLLEPGETPHENMQFLVFLCAVVRAVHRYAAMLRLGTVSAGNDHRLGGFEAPPAIFSMFLGTQLGEVVDSIIQGVTSKGKKADTIQIGVTALPPLPRDATDRNRTSPVAFTGNKFEFRPVGAAQSTSPMCFMINTAVTEALDTYATALEAAVAAGKPLNEAVQKLLKKEFKVNSPVIFNGDNYHSSWPKEAKKRGLPNLADSVSALQNFASEDIVAVLSRYGVLSEREIESRRDILLESYSTTVDIEAQVTLEMGRTIILPAALEWQDKLASFILNLRKLSQAADTEGQEMLLHKVSRHVRDFMIALDRLDEELGKKSKHSKKSPVEEAKFFRDTVLPIMNACRAEGDALENLVDDELWPMPKYRELLWIY